MGLAHKNVEPITNFNGSICFAVHIVIERSIEFIEAGVIKCDSRNDMIQAYFFFFVLFAFFAGSFAANVRAPGTWPRKSHLPSSTPLWRRML